MVYIFCKLLTFFLSVASGYRELVEDGETPMVGSDYLLEALDDFQYDMSFTVHVSQGTFLYNTRLVLSSRKITLQLLEFLIFFFS